PEAMENLDWEQMTEEMLERLEMELGQGEAEAGLDELPQGDEAPYESPEPIDCRGGCKPELGQLLKRMPPQDIEGDDEDVSPLTPEQIKELLEKSVEVDMNLEDEFDMSAFNQLMENLEREAGAEPSDDDADAEGEEPPPVPLTPAIKTFYYD